jgi:hypothetical protein
MPQHMGGHGSTDMRLVGDLLHQGLHGADADLQAVMQGEMAFQQGLDAWGQRHHAAFGALPLRPAFAVDHEAVVLPVEVVSGEVGQFRHAEAGLQQGPATSVSACVRQAWANRLASSGVRGSRLS